MITTVIVVLTVIIFTVMISNACPGLFLIRSGCQFSTDNVIFFLIFSHSFIPPLIGELCIYRHKNPTCVPCIHCSRVCPLPGAKSRRSAEQRSSRGPPDKPAALRAERPAVAAGRIRGRHLLRALSEIVPRPPALTSENAFIVYMR